MKSKTKLRLAIVVALTVFVLLISIIFVLFMFGYRTYSNLSFMFKSQGVYGYVQASYINSGIKTQMTTDGTEKGNIRVNYNGENGRAETLKILGNGFISLSRSSPFVVFEYQFANTNKTSPFYLTAIYNDTQDKDENIKMTYGYFDHPSYDFSLLTEDFDNNLSNVEVPSDTQVFVYIKIQVDDDLQNANVSGDFVFNLTSN